MYNVNKTYKLSILKNILAEFSIKNLFKSFYHFTAMDFTEKKHNKICF